MGKSRDQKVARALQDFTGASYMACLTKVRDRAQQLVDEGHSRAEAYARVEDEVGRGELLGLKLST